MNSIFNSAKLLACSFMLFSCSTNDADDAQVRTQANKDYVTPNTRSFMQNPASNLSNQFPVDIGVSHSYGDRSKNYIAMTFDDGPHPTNTPRLLDILKARNIKATFFVIGENVQRYPAIARRIVAEGHEIANHTWTHANLTKVSTASLRSELNRTRDIIRSTTGVLPRVMRPPYGALLQNQRQMIFREYGYPTIMWAVDPRDWQRPGVSVVTSRILNSTTNGSIVLAHDLHAPTISAMPATFDGLLRKGFRFVTVSQLLTLKAQSRMIGREKPVPSDVKIAATTVEVEAP